MKKLNYLIVIIFFSLSLTFNGCSKDTSLEIIDQADIENVNLETKGSRSSCDYQVAVNYNFASGLTTQEMNNLKVAYRAHMSQYFTICNVQEFETCPGSEIWRINGQEYYNNPYYPNFPPLPGESADNDDSDDDSDGIPTQGAGSSNDNITKDPRFRPTIGPYVSSNGNPIDDCFDEKEANLNDHLGGL